MKSSKSEKPKSVKAINEKTKCLLACIVGVLLLTQAGIMLDAHPGIWWLVLFVVMVFVAQPFLYYGYGGMDTGWERTRQEGRDRKRARERRARER